MKLDWLSRAAAIGALAMTLAGLPAEAQEYPTRNVTIVVPLAAGSGMDAIVRVYAEDLAKALGKPVVVENQPGAALMLAAQNVARAAPDGHTLVVASAPVLAVNPTLYKKVNYDAEKDFAPIALYAKSPFVLIVNPAFGAKSMQDYIKKAQDSANPLTYATTGAGTLQFLTMEVLKRDHKFKASHVAYRSPPQIVNDIVGGHIVSSISETGAALSLIQEGKIEALGITASARLPALPQGAHRGRGDGHARLRGRLLARAAGAVEDPAAGRRAPARGDEAHHRQCRVPEAREHARPDAARAALDRGDRALHQERARALGRRGDRARPRPLAVMGSTLRPGEGPAVFTQSRPGGRCPARGSPGIWLARTPPQGLLPPRSRRRHSAFDTEGEESLRLASSSPPSVAIHVSFLLASRMRGCRRAQAGGDPTAIGSHSSLRAARRTRSQLCVSLDERASS